MTLFLPRELTALKTGLTQTRNTSHGMERLMKGREIEKVVPKVDG